jgi:hypothetical protein
MENSAADSIATILEADRWARSDATQTMNRMVN